jgi:hypothetical protein
MMRKLHLPLLVVLFSGCLYTNIHTPRAYRSATPADVKARIVDDRVEGKACYRTALFMVSWGDGSYRKAVRNALAGRQDHILYDVRSDVQISSVLIGLYTRICTVVSGRVGAP